MKKEISNPPKSTQTKCLTIHTYASSGCHLYPSQEYEYAGYICAKCKMFSKLVITIKMREENKLG